MKIQPSRRAGFTLVEIMVVVGIIGVLAPIAIPNFMKARTAAQTNTCINNIRAIDTAKQEWATETLQGPGATPTSDDLEPYLGRGDGSLERSFCPLDPDKTIDTSFDIGNVLTAPLCNFKPDEHVLL